ncbi:MAG: hypothetical protein K6E95_03625 [Lachnospiraceae bacterium]|nr:hypothetical protein [Lachnospiraceae bacterium]
MRTIKEILVAAAMGIIFVSAVTVLLFASEQRKKAERQVYAENRYERLLAAERGPA